MNLTLSTAIAIGSIVVAGTSVTLAGFQKYKELESKVGANTTYRLLQEYEIHEKRREQRPLTTPEWFKYCSSGKKLGIFNRCPARRRR